MNWYSTEIDEVYKNFDSSVSGLDQDRVSLLRSKYGENKLPEGKHITYIEIFFNQFKSPLIYILLGSALIVLFLGDFESAVVIGVVLLINSIIGTIQEGKAERTLNALKRFVTTKATVLRNGTEMILDDFELVPGDIVLLREGSKVPSDARIITEEDIKVDESALTGESEAVYKDTAVLKSENLAPQDQKNMLFRGTYVLGGNAKAIVVATGADTLIGKISTELQSLDTELPLKTQIKKLSKILIIVVLFLVLILFFIGIFSGVGIKEMFGVVVAMSVSAIPEGLPVVVTLILATGVNRMTKRNALVKNLQAVEALGQADVIAVDKTGTITHNQMQVLQVCTESGVYDIGGEGYEPRGSVEQNGQIINANEREDLMLLGKICSLTADAHVSFDKEKQSWQRVSGDPTEVALLVLSEKLGFSQEAETKESPKILEIPFSSDTRFHATINSIKGKKVFFIAGAPELIIEHSVEVFTNDGQQFYDEKIKNYFLSQMKSMSNAGLRIVALAVSEHNIKENDFKDIPKLSFVGIVGIKDAIRSEVYDSIDLAHKAGIKVVMITGDHIDTARAIGREIGIYKEGDIILTGHDLDTLPKHELKKKIVHTSVFARVTPNHKMAIVNAYKNADLIIAMTGDGVNDALSLASAQLGVSMGKTGTDVAKEASDIILLDDNFGSIVYAVEEGRNIYKTIKKVLMYLLSTSLGEIFALMGAIALGLPIPFSASQIIWLNFVTDGFLVVALALEPKDKNLLSQKMKKTDQKLVNKEMLVRMFVMGMVMMIGTIVFFDKYIDESFLRASTMALTLLAVYQWLNAFNCRSDRQSIFKMNLFSNKYLLWAFGIVVGLQFIAVYTPFFNNFLDTEPISLKDWLTIGLFALSIIAIDEIYKLLKFGFLKIKNEKNA